MKEILRNHLISRLGNNVDNLDLVLSNFIEIKAKRNVMLVEVGKKCDYVYFIAKGCLQVFVYDSQLNEVTRDIVVEGTWCSELTSFGSGNPSTENIRTIESCELLAIDRKGFAQMMEDVPQFDKVYRQILEASYSNSIYRLNTFMKLSALERIKWLMEFRPQLMTRISSKLIASYLGINKDVFSRLKTKL